VGGRPGLLDRDQAAWRRVSRWRRQRGWYPGALAVVADAAWAGGDGAVARPGRRDQLGRTALFAARVVHSDLVTQSEELSPQGSRMAADREAGLRGCRSLFIEKSVMEATQSWVNAVRSVTWTL
jgi:hypothetical protein